MKDPAKQDRRPLNEAQIARLLERIGSRPQPPDAAMTAAREQVRSVWKNEVNARRRQRRSFTGWAMAASVFLALGLGLMLTRAPAPDMAAWRLAHRVKDISYRPAGTGEWLPVDDATDLAVGDRLRTGSQSYALLELPEDVTVRMDAGSELELRAAQQLYMPKGAIYVDAPGAGALLVETPRGSARDIGTRFEVRLMDEGWRIQVRDGRVLMNDRAQGQAEAAAGERLLAADGGLERQSVSPADASWQWTYRAARPMVIEGSTLGAYLAWWSREAGLTVDYARPLDATIAGQTRLHGDLTGLTLEQGFQAVVSGAGFRVVDRDEQQVIVAR